MISVEIGFVLVKLLFASLTGRTLACKCLVMHHCRNIPLVEIGKFMIGRAGRVR